MAHRSLTLVAYDITENRRRARALGIVKAFGLGGQKSVHECALSKRERRELKAEIEAILDPKTDKLMIVPLDPRGAVRALGQSRPAKPPAMIMIG